MMLCEHTQTAVKLIVFADSIDERTAVKLFIRKPNRQSRKYTINAFSCRPSATFNAIKEPFAPPLAVNLKNRLDQFFFGSERFIERRFGGSSLFYNCINANSIDAITPE